MLAKMGKFVNFGMELLATEKAIKKDTGKMLEKQDSLLGKHDKTVSEVKGLREDLKSYMEERFERIEREISVIKAKIGIL